LPLHFYCKFIRILVLKAIKNIYMSKTIWIIILVIVVVLLWYIFRGDSEEVDTTPVEDGTEQVDENVAPSVDTSNEAPEGGNQDTETPEGENNQ
jgi:hypothetical protein